MFVYVFLSYTLKIPLTVGGFAPHCEVKRGTRHGYHAPPVLSEPD